jgi:hypothetical protein
VVACWWVGMPIARADSSACENAARLQGDSSAIRELSWELARRGVIANPAASCDAPVFYVSSPEEGYLIALVTRSGQSVLRKMGTAEAAAKLIAWLVHDSGALHESPRTAAEAAFASAEPANRTSERGWSQVDVAAEILMSSHDSGASVFGSVCSSIGVTCLGGAIRGLGASVSGGQADTARTGVDLLLIIEEPIHAASVVITPSQAVGGGVLRTFLPEGCSACGSSGATDRATIGGRIEIGVGVAFPVAERLALNARAGLTWFPAAHTDPFVVSSSSSISPILPGEPVLWGHVGFGVQLQ